MFTNHQNPNSGVFYFKRLIIRKLFCFLFSGLFFKNKLMVQIEKKHQYGVRKFYY